MMLIPHVHPFFLPIVKWSPWIRWLVLLAVVAIITGVFYGGIQYGLHAWITCEHVFINQLKKQVRSAHMAESESLRLEASSAQLQQLIEAKSGIHQPKSYWNIVADLLQLMHTNGLHVKQYTHGKDDSSVKNNVIKKIITIDYSGAPEAINQFFVQLKDTKKMLQIKRIHVNVLDEEHHPTYVVSIDIALIHVTNEKSLQLKQAEGLGG